MSLTVRDDRLTIMSWRGRWGQALRTAVSNRFERDAGITVDHRYHVGLALPAALTDALANGEPPPCDVVWSNSVPALRAAAAGFCEPLDPGYVPTLDQLPARALVAGAAGIAVVHPYVVHYVLGYRAGLFPAGGPRSWDALLDARHMGKFAMYPGGNGFYPIAQVMGGGDVGDIPNRMEACWAYLDRLRDAIGVVDYSVGMEKLFHDGKLELCFRALPNVLGFRAAGVPMDWTVPDEGTTDTLDALWIPRGIPESKIELAMRYINTSLQPQTQLDWCAQLGTLPVHPDSEAPDILRRNGLPDGVDDLTGILHIPESVKASHESEWAARFREFVLR